MRGQQIDAWPATLPLSSVPSFRGGTFYKVSGHKPISSSGKNGLRSRPRATLTDIYQPPSGYVSISAAVKYTRRSPS